MKTILTALILFLLIGTIYSQTSPDYIFGNDMGNGWSWTTGTQGISSLGNSYKWQFQASVNGNQEFKFGETSSNVNGSGFWYVGSGPNVQYPGGGNFGDKWTAYYHANYEEAGVFYFSVTSGEYYVIKSRKQSGNNADFVIMHETSAPVNITNVSQTISGINLTVTITTSATPASSERFWLRYTTNNWTTSSTVQLTGSGTSYSATLSLNYGDFVSYYVYSTFNITSAPAESDANLYAINYNDNSSNYYSALIHPNIIIDGNLNEGSYQSLATKQNNNQGFGSNIDVTQILYYPDNTNNILFIGVKGKLDVSKDDGIGIWINLDNGSGLPTGTSAGNPLGISGLPQRHYIGASNGNFSADFEVDYMFAINPGSSSTNCYVDAASRVGTPAKIYLGNCGQSGSAINYSTNGTVFASGYTISFAFNNSGGSNTGFEIAIPYGAIGASSSMSIEAFAFVVSPSAYFSNVTVPGNITGGNLGFDPDFSSLSGGPYHSNASALPVQLSNIRINSFKDQVLLTWSTATEVQNYGWEVERSKVDKSTNKASSWQSIGFVKGAGNSNSPKEYSFVDNSALYGEYAYRLKQIDIDGSTSYSDELRVFVGKKPEVYDVKAFPNPFNPETKIRFELPEAGNVKLSIYDLTGRLISTLVDEYLDEGIYEREFNGSNLSSGIYFTILQSKNVRIVRKLQLIK